MSDVVQEGASRILPQYSGREIEYDAGAQGEEWENEGSPVLSREYQRGLVDQKQQDGAPKVSPQVMAVSALVNPEASRPILIQ